VQTHFFHRYRQLTELHNNLRTSHREVTIKSKPMVGLTHIFFEGFSALIA